MRTVWGAWMPHVNLNISWFLVLKILGMEPGVALVPGESKTVTGNEHQLMDMRGNSSAGEKG